LSLGEETGTWQGPMKWVELMGNTRDVGGALEHKTDAEQRRHREQRGLETPVVYAVKDVCGA
jgi:hypothetical protein